MPDSPIQVDLDDVLGEMNDLGRALFDAAFSRVQVKRLQAEVARLQNGQQPAKADA